MVPHSSVTAGYQETGLYLSQVTIRDSSGNEYRDNVIVNVLDKAEIDAILQAKWAGMKSALIQGEIESALDHFSFSAREKYSNAFTSLQSTIGDIASNMSNIELVYLRDNIAKYRIRRNQIINGQAQTITYYIYFSQNVNGAWQIEQF